MGDQDDDALGRNEGKKKIMVVGIEGRTKGVYRWTGRVVAKLAYPYKEFIY